jgi:hypothetical protein
VYARDEEFNGNKVGQLGKREEWKGRQDNGTHIRHSKKREQLTGADKGRGEKGKRQGKIR